MRLKKKKHLYTITDGEFMVVLAREAEVLLDILTVAKLREKVDSVTKFDASAVNYVVLINLLNGAKLYICIYNIIQLIILIQK